MAINPPFVHNNMILMAETQNALPLPILPRSGAPLWEIASDSIGRVPLLCFSKVW